MTGRVLVTGASSGIGRALAREFAAHGRDLVLVARDEERLEAVTRSVDTDATVLPQDLSEPDAATAVTRGIEANGAGPIKVLVNAAGIGSTGAFVETPGDRERDLVDVNVGAVIELTKTFLPGMVKRDTGGVLNVASVAAFVPGPLNAVYHASKAAVLSFTESIAEELAGTNVTATALCPGSTRTAFQYRKGAETPRPDEIDQMEPEPVAAAGYEGFVNGERVVIPGWKNRLVVAATRILPRRLLARLSMQRARKYTARGDG